MLKHTNKNLYDQLFLQLGIWFFLLVLVVMLSRFKGCDSYLEVTLFFQMLKVAPHETSSSRRVGKYRYYHRKSCLLNGWSLLLLISSAVLVHIDKCKVFICSTLKSWSVYLTIRITPFEGSFSYVIFSFWVIGISIIHGKAYVLYIPTVYTKSASIGRLECIYKVNWVYRVCLYSYHYQLWRDTWFKIEEAAMVVWFPAYWYFETKFGFDDI